MPLGVGPRRIFTLATNLTSVDGATVDIQIMLYSRAQLQTYQEHFIQALANGMITAD
jgi:hypothetical protein